MITGAVRHYQRIRGEKMEEKTNLEKIKEEMTPELACELIGHVIDELKDPDKLRIVKRIYNSGKDGLSVDEILRIDVHNIQKLHRLGILGKEKSNSMINPKDVFFITEFTKQLLNLPKKEE